MQVHRRIIVATLSISLLTQLTACGTIFYPERRGQISGKIDPAVAITDAIGLFFYIIPGLLAFTVDFITGAIYLPGGKHASVDPQRLRHAIGPDGQIDNRRLKTIIEQETGLSLPLDHPQLIQQHGNRQQLAALGLCPAA